MASSLGLLILRVFNEGFSTARVKKHWTKEEDDDWLVGKVLEGSEHGLFQDLSQHVWRNLEKSQTSHSDYLVTQ